jgi:hypothetical protein
MPDVQFIKNNLTADDNLTFLAFPLQDNLTIANTNTPEYYISHNCTTAGTGETLKVYQFPISLHINNLADLNFTVAIQAASSSSSAITLELYQFTGTTTSGTSSPAPTRIAQSSLQLTPTFTPYTLTDLFPPASGLILSIAGDDAFYLQVAMPLNQLCNVQFTKPSLYLSNNEIPEVDYNTYDSINAIISAPRCGDIRLSINKYGVPLGLGVGSFGWVYANDGTIGSTASGASARANNDTWLLYYNLWTNVSQANCPVSGGRTAGINGAFTDFSLNKRMALPVQLGRVVGDAGNGLGLPTRALAETGVFAVTTGPGALAATFYDLTYKL